jgi:hypothetical protein
MGLEWPESWFKSEIRTQKNLVFGFDGLPKTLKILNHNPKKTKIHEIQNPIPKSDFFWIFSYKIQLK